MGAGAGRPAQEESSVSDWPFAEARNVPSFTVDRVLGGADIVRVFHDLDGFWQFYDAEPVDAGNAALVPLEMVVEIDPTVAALADLPRGFVAERAGPGEEWTRSSQFPLEWDALLAEGDDYVSQQREGIEADFTLSSFGDPQLDTEDGRLCLTSDDGEQLHADVTLIGSFSADPPMWLWGWANTAMDELMTAEMAAVRAFGEEHGVEPLTKAQFPATPEEAARVANVGARILEADHVWPLDTENGRMFLALFDVRPDGEEEVEVDEVEGFGDGD